MTTRRTSSDFVFVVGAPRCGTTSISTYLKQHPDVCFSQVKEPHFFSRFDLPSLSCEEQDRFIEREYLARYFPPDADGSGLLMAEGSVSYLYAPERMETILRIWPNAKFVIALRDPMEMLPSLHQRLLFMGDETETDFARAWSLVDDRREGRSIPGSCIDHRFLMYDEIGMLGKYVERFVAAVGRDRCFFSLFDDLSANPGAVYRDLLEFLGLSDDGRQDFPRCRASRGYKVAWLQRLLKRPPGAALAGEHFWIRVKPNARADAAGRDVLKAIWSVRKTLLRWNRAPAPKARLSSAIRQEIHAAFASDAQRLAGLLGRDLIHWLSRDAKEVVQSSHAGRDHRTKGFAIRSAR
jgi:hypothetical protein